MRLVKQRQHSISVEEFKSVLKEISDLEVTSLHGVGTQALVIGDRLSFLSPLNESNFSLDTDPVCFSRSRQFH